MTAYSTLLKPSNAAVIIGVLFTLVLGLPQEGLHQKPDGPLPCNLIPTVINGQKYYGTCKCNGQNLLDETKCLKTSRRNDDEPNGKPGTCLNGECLLRNVTRGCAETQAPPIKTSRRNDDEPNGKPGTCLNGECLLRNVTRGCAETQAPPIPAGVQPPAGCVFFCNTTVGLYGYFPKGTKCQHITSGSNYVNGTCQPSEGRMVCTDKVDLPPAC
uniref:Putative secreted protein n=1 Tax=Amblyomma cajennense TaxID=34607 RepID=A0A023FEE5_AMBCJ